MAADSTPRIDRTSIASIPGRAHPARRSDDRAGRVEAATGADGAGEDRASHQDPAGAERPGPTVRAQRGDDPGELGRRLAHDLDVARLGAVGGEALREAVTAGLLPL